MNKKETEIYHFVETQWKAIRKKHIRSLFIFIFFNLMLIVLSSLAIFLNLYAVRYNSVFWSKVLFIAIAIIVGFIAVLSSIASLFDFKNKYYHLKKLNSSLNDEYKLYKDFQSPYDEPKQRDQKFIEKIISIYDNSNQD